MKKIKAFLKRHSYIVVFIIAIAIAIANYMVYPMFIKKELNLSEVPVSKKSLSALERIYEDSVTTISVNADLLPKGIILDREKIRGMYVKENAFVPEGSFFYAESLTNESEAYGNTLSQLSDGEFAYTMEVPEKYDDGKLYKGQLVNIYLSCENEKVSMEGKKTVTRKTSLFGLLKENVRIIQITDAGEKRFVTYALTEEDISYFKVAEYVAGNYRGEVFPLVYFGSNPEKSSTTCFYDEDGLRAWLKEKGDIYEYPEETRSEMLNGKTDIEKQDETDGGYSY